MLNKPINAYPYNCCVDATEGVQIKYEIPNNETIDGVNIYVNDLETGKCVFEESQDVSDSENSESKVVCDVANLSTNKEYSWNSFYWKEPTVDGENRAIVGYSTETKELFLRPKGSISVSNKVNISINMYNDKYQNVEPDYRIWYPTEKYDLDIYTNGDDDDHGHTLGDDTSEFCYKGNLEDFFGFRGFWTTRALVNKIKEIGLGKCVIELSGEVDGSLVKFARVRVLAYDTFYYTDDRTTDFFCIVDFENLDTMLKEAGTVKPVSSSMGNIYKITHIDFYNIDDLNSNEDIKGLLKYNDKNFLISSAKFKDHYYTISLFNSDLKHFEEATIKNTVQIWGYEDVNFNTTPTYYFRTKTPPNISINDFSILNNGALSDTKCKFGINYESSNSLNYFYLYLYVFNSQSSKWEIKERSPMIYNTNDTYKFIGFADGQKYKVSGVCTDKDGDEWTTEDVEFTVTNSAISTYNTLATFNKQKTTIDLYIKEILDNYNTASVEFYKVLKNDMDAIVKLEYAGGRLAKSNGVVYFDKWCDYNIKNDSHYDYYVRVSYTGKESDADKGVDFYLVGSDIHTEFQGTSILGLKKISDIELGIAQNFNLLYHFGDNMSELTNEISREYVNSFNKYPKELKGHQNHISGSCSGLLGSEKNGIYEEPKGIRAVWKDFVNDDTIKLYRGLDGETMIISIDTSRVKPFYYPGVGLVNEIYITFKEISPTNQYSIFATEKTG